MSALRKFFSLPIYPRVVNRNPTQKDIGEAIHLANGIWLQVCYKTSDDWKTWRTVAVNVASRYKTLAGEIRYESFEPAIN